MKNTLIITGLALVFLSACKSSQLASFSDDVYANPAEEKTKARLAAEARQKQEAEEQAQQEKARLAQQAADSANPYYQDPKQDADDYYDYQYASRINRFQDPLPGAGYYDSRYTNYYTYNQNPAMYGTSIYNSYNWMPSNQFGYYSSGVSMNFGNAYGSYGYPMGGYGYNPMYMNSWYMSNPYSYGYGGYYDPFGYSAMYNPYGYNPYGSFGYGVGLGYGGYGMGFYNGYNMGYYNGYYSGYSGWGYLNSYDANSGYTYGPRNSGGGATNAMRVTNGGSAPLGDREALYQSVAHQQETTPRFTETARSSNPMRSGNANSGFTNGGNMPQNAGSPRSVNPRNAAIDNNGYSNNNSNNNAMSPRSINSQPVENAGNSNNSRGSFNQGGIREGSSIRSNSMENNSRGSINSGSRGGFNSGGGGGGGFSSPAGGSRGSIRR